MPSAELAAAACRAIASKTKPPGSLGQLERRAVQLSCLQETLEPRADRARILVFGADHGLSHAGVSAYPREVTVEMMRNFATGGAAIHLLARSAGFEVEVIDVGVDGDLAERSRTYCARTRPRTHEPPSLRSAAWRSRPWRERQPPPHDPGWR